MVKAITQSDPTFLKTVYKHDSLVDLVNHERFVDIGERYIVYNQKCGVSTRWERIETHGSVDTSRTYTSQSPMQIKRKEKGSFGFLFFGLL